MSQYGKLFGTITDANGAPLSGATVEVRRQGAFVTSTQAGPSYTVDDPGGIVVGDQVRPNALSSPSRNVSAVNANTVTTSGAGLGTMNNGDRISPFSTLPTLYADAVGVDTKANPLTTDASGFWYCWVPIRPYDLIETYGSTVRLKTDVVPDGHEYVQSNVFSGGPQIAYRRGTTRTITAGKLDVLENPIGVTEKYSVDFAGNVVAAGNVTAVNGTFTGNMSLTGDLTVDDIIADDITGNDLFLGTSMSYTGAAGSWSMTAKSIETQDLDDNCAIKTYVGTGTTDQTLVAAAAYADVTSATVTFTPFSSASEIVILATVPIESAGAGGYTAYARIVDGAAATVYNETGCLEPNAVGGLPTSMFLVGRITGLTGSQTFKVQAKVVNNNGVILSSSTDRKCKIVVMEFKK